MDLCVLTSLLKNARERANLTQARLAGLMDVCASTISRWERTGCLTNGRLITWMELCECVIEIHLDRGERLRPCSFICRRCERAVGRGRCSAVITSMNRQSKGGCWWFIGAIPEDCPYHVEQLVAGNM